MSDLEESRIWCCSFEVSGNMSGFLPCLRKRVITPYLDLEFWENLCNDLLFHFSKPLQGKILYCLKKWEVWWMWNRILLLNSFLNFISGYKIPTRWFWVEMYEFTLINFQIQIMIICKSPVGHNLKFGLDCMAVGSCPHL